MADHIDAIIHGDFDLAESLRGTLSASQVQEIIETYYRLSNWPSKDLAVHLLQDYPSDKVKAVMRDALASPTPGTRAVAYCVITGNDVAFGSFLSDGFVDPKRVDAAIQSMDGN